MEISERPAAEVEDGGACAGRGGGFGPAAFAAPLVAFSEDGSKGVFTARAQNNKSCWILALDPNAAKARLLFKDEDPAWVGGPGGGQGWLADNQTYYFTSEKDGFNHLYEVPFTGGTPKQLTSGKFEIDKVELSRDKSKFYLTSSQDSDYAERNLWSLDVNGGEATRITKVRRYARCDHLARRSMDRGRLLVHEQATRAVHSAKRSRARPPRRSPLHLRLNSATMRGLIRRS